MTIEKFIVPRIQGILGGTDPLPVVRGALDGDVALEPLDGYVHDGALLLRYRVARGV